LWECYPLVFNLNFVAPTRSPRRVPLQLHANGAVADLTSSVRWTLWLSTCSHAPIPSSRVTVVATAATQATQPIFKLHVLPSTYHPYPGTIPYPGEKEKMNVPSCDAFWGGFESYRGVKRVPPPTPRKEPRFLTVTPAVPPWEPSVSAGSSRASSRRSSGGRGGGDGCSEPVAPSLPPRVGRDRGGSQPPVARRSPLEVPGGAARFRQSARRHDLDGTGCVGRLLPHAGSPCP
jgi:hypothetical protein